MARIEKVLIWGGWLRVSHLAVGFSALVLLATGWLLESAPSVAADAMDFHFLAAGVLVAGLLLRLVLMFFGSPIERLSQLMPEDDEWRAVRDTLMFYLSFGRAPLPRWYSHNPLWKPLYLLFYICLLFLVFTGAIMQDSPLLWGWYLPKVHAVFAGAVAWLTGLHVLAVILHDYRGDAADTSAIINGHRHFVIEEPSTEQIKAPPSINLMDIGGTGKDQSE